MVQEIKRLSKEIADTYPNNKPKPEQPKKKKTKEPPKDRFEALKRKSNASGNRTKWRKEKERAMDENRRQHCEKKIAEFDAIMREMDEFISNQE